jgi:carboxyl-terminal processing protease
MPGGNLFVRASRDVVCLAALVGVIALQPFVLAQETPRPVTPDPLAISHEDTLKVFEKLWETINNEYFDPKFNGVDWAQMKEKYRPRVEVAKTKQELHDVLQEMLGELHSSHLEVRFNVKLNEARIEQDVSRKAGRKEHFVFGAGLNFARVEERQVISSVSEGSGAQLAGVQRGWMLTHWNGEPYRSNTSTSCDLGEKLNLRFTDLRGQERNLDVVCKLFPLPGGPPERISRTLDGGTVYLHFTGFKAGTNDWLVDQVARNHSASAIIIDLRGNGGGLLSVLRKCFEPFFSDSTIFGEFRERNGKEPTLKVSGRGHDAYSGRVFVLIDEMSASAAEIFAAGVQESGRGIVVGRQSSGAVLMNYEHGLPNGFKASIAIRDYQTAKGVRLEGRGVIPDEPVKLTMRDFMENRDPDLERVRELLRHTP